MNQSRWRKIEDLFESAVEMEPAQRERYLAETCAGDDQLREEVAGLLACHDRAGEFLEAPAAERMPGRARLPSGERLGPYRIIALLGAGGMGEVYSATDTRLDRTVAIKLLPRQFAGDAQAAKRFQREARAVSALNHPNICTLYDIGEHDGRPYLVMELVEGRSLKERLTESSLPVDEVVACGRQIASALEAAHSKGIVHRDIKPANVLITGRGQAKILDFGLAKLLPEPDLQQQAPPSPAPLSTESTISIPGWTPGTVSYMSPEQARGEPVDQRTDLFSLGVTLYEMATGHKPFEGEAPSLVIAALLGRQPARPRQLRPDLPASLERIILKALEKDKQARYQTAAEMRSDLENLQPGKPSRAILPLGAAAVASLTLFLSVPDARSWLLDRLGFAQPSGPPPRAQRLAVLPFGAPESSVDHRLLIEGIGDAIATDLGQLPGVRVFSAPTAERYRDTEKSAGTIARELGADAVLVGAARIEGTRLEVRPRLMRPGAGEPAWTQSFVGDLGNIRAIRIGIAREVARALLGQVPPETERHLTSGGTASREAFENYLRGRHYWSKRTDKDIQRAVSFFKAAIDADPAYSAAYAGLADCYNQFATVAIGRDPRENRRLAIAAARRAIQIDDRNAEAHAALGFSLLYDWDWAGAERELSRALDLNPSYASARVWHATSLVIRRRPDEAIAEVDRARELDPLSPITQTQAGWIRALSGRTVEAIEIFRRVLASEPDYPWAVMQLAGCLTETGQHREAIALFEKGVAQSSDNPVFWGQLGKAYAEAGRRRDALRVLEKLTRMSRERYVTPHAPAHVCLGLGDLDCYFQYLEEGYRQRMNYMAFLSVIPLPRNHPAVRQDPRFQDLLRRMGHEPDPVLARQQ